MEDVNKRQKMNYFIYTSHQTTKCYFSFRTWTWFLEIQLQEGLPSFGEVSEQE